MPNYARLIHILRTLVAFRTVSAHHAEADKCLAYIEQLTAGFKLYTNRYVSNGFHSMVLSTRDTKQPKVLLQAHLDVVPAYDHQFSLQQKDGLLYGRGVYDMKFAAACFLFLLEELHDELPDLDFAVMLTTDEEVDGRNGVEYLLNQGYTAPVCVLPDSGENWSVEAAAKGFATAEVIAEGRSAHGSRPWEADNAGLKILKIVEYIGAAFPASDRLGTTVTPTIIRAGSAYNQIPGEATATFDIRFPNEPAYQQAKRTIEELSAAQGVSVVFTEQAVSVTHQLDSDYVQTWQAATASITGKQPAFSQSFAASDARYFVPRGIPTISARPRGGGHHSGEEWLSEHDFYQFYEVVKYFVLHTARDPIDG